MLHFDRQGLIPAVVVDDTNGDVLMVAFMNREAFEKTRETGFTHYFSRSRNTIWRKGEQSGNVQEVRDIFVNCEENSLLIRVVQHGGAACHTGHRTCYYRRLLPDDTFETIAEPVFDPAIVYGNVHNAQNEFALSEALSSKPFPIAINSKISSSENQNAEVLNALETTLRQLYGVYLYLRDHDLSEQSNTSRLLQEHSHGYLVTRLADELQELAGVQSGEHVHSGQQEDTILEGSQVGYWLLLLAATHNLPYDDFAPHLALLNGYNEEMSENRAIELWQECLNLLNAHDQNSLAQGLQAGFSFIGWACHEADISILAPSEYDLAQMRKKGLA